jgi:hypothetical protein
LGFIGGKNFGAGDRGRTGDVQLGNFLLNLMISSFGARAYSIFPAFKTFFRAAVISTSFTRSTFGLGTFWERGSSLGGRTTLFSREILQFPRLAKWQRLPK